MNKQDLGTFDKVYKPYKHRADNSGPEYMAAFSVIIFIMAMAIACLAIGG